MKDVTPIENEMLEKLIRTAFSMAEFRILLTVCRETAKARHCQFDNAFLSKATGLRFSTLNPALRRLCLRGLLTGARKGLGPRIYSLVDQEARAAPELSEVQQVSR